MKNTFEVVSGKVCLSDPCYQRGTWCGKYDVPAQNGIWEVSYKDVDGTVHGFTASLQDYSSVDTKFFDVGVDSGQFGIFDSSIYIYGEGDFDQPGFYKDCCDATMSRKSCGIIQDRGFVASSGYGDGSYNILALFNKNDELVSISVDFVEDDDWDDDWDDEDGDAD